MFSNVYDVALGRALYQTWERLRGRPTFPLLAYLHRMERASADELAALRSGLLRRLVHHAVTRTAHYKSAYGAVAVTGWEIRTLDDLHALPVLERATAQRTVAERTADWPRVAFSKTTSGSTGQPLEIRYSDESRHWRDATRWRGFGWADYRMGNKAVHVWGVPAVEPGRWQRARLVVDRKLRRDVYVSCMVRSPAALRAMVETIRREKPTVIAGYAQAIADLARYVNAEGLRDWGTISVICGAERLWSHDREDLERAFGPKVFETYGCREFMLMGSECEVHDGLHESMENLIVEILVREPGGRTRAAHPGEEGEVAVTDLHNLASPFIRYLTGDLAVARADTPCPCGRTLRRFGPVAGRVTDTMRDADGNRVEGVLFNILFLNLSNYARQFQVVQRSDDHVTLRIVSTGAAALPPEAERTIRAFVATHLRGVPFAIEVVADLPLSAAGKLHRVIVEKKRASDPRSP